MQDQISMGGRKWLEGAHAKPEWFKLAKGCLVALLAFGKDREAQFAGTGFVVAISDDGSSALVLTAKHVLTEGVVNMQRPHRGHAPSALALFLSQHASQPTLGDEKLLAFWADDRDSAHLLSVDDCAYADAFDLAVCIVRSNKPNSFAPKVFPLNMRLPVAGDQVHVLSLDGLDAIEEQPPLNRKTGAGQRLTLNRRVCVRVGTVLEVFPEGNRQFKWPCFTTTIPVTGGMSGGVVYQPGHDGEPAAAIGVVCADCSSKEAHLDHGLAGESVMGCSFGALTLTIPKGEARATLFDLVKAGQFPMPLGNMDHVNISQIVDQVTYGFRYGAPLLDEVARRGGA